MSDQKKKKEKCIRVLRTNLLVMLTLVGAVVGFGIGLAARSAGPSEDALMWLGAASIDPKSNGKISAVSLVYILVTNFLSCIVGTMLGIIIEPGKGISGYLDINTTKTAVLQTGDIFADLLRNLLPDNIITATFEQAQTQYHTKEIVQYIMTNGTNTSKVIKEITGRYDGSTPSSNIVGLIVISSLFGLATSAMKDVGKPFYIFFNSACEIILQILKWLIWSTPLSVASLNAKTIASTLNIEEDFRKLGVYFVTVMIGLLIFNIVLVPLVYFLVQRTNPFRFLLTIIEPMLIAFAAAATAMAIPQTLKCLEDTNGIEKHVTRFVVPFSAALGRCGSCIYISTSCVFIMQLLGSEIDVTKVIMVILLTTVSSLAIPSVTGSCFVTIIIILTALNIPAEAVSLLIALDWFLDRAGSITNICVQCLGSVITYKVCKSSLPPPPHVQILEDMLEEVRVDVTVDKLDMMCNGVDEKLHNDDVGVTDNRHKMFNSVDKTRQNGDIDVNDNVLKMFNGVDKQNGDINITDNVFKMCSGVD